MRLTTTIMLKYYSSYDIKNILQRDYNYKKFLPYQSSKLLLILPPPGKNNFHIFFFYPQIPKIVLIVIENRISQ